MSFEKIYIGKGNQVPNLPIAKVTIPLEKLQEIAYEMDGVKYVTFEVSKMKSPDKFGREYSCFYSKKVADQKAAKKNSGKRKKKEANADLPF